MSEIRITVGEEASKNLIVVSQELQNVIDVVTKGTQGPAGTQIIDGEGVPSNSIGRIGDYFFDRPEGRLYGPKTTVGWGDTYIELLTYLGLDDLTDVDATEPTEQDVLMYEDSTNTWKNQRIRYRHDQGTPSDVWTINHGLKTKPAAIAIFDTSDTMVFGDVNHVNENQVVLSFSAVFAGVAYLT